MTCNVKFIQKVLFEDSIKTQKNLDRLLKSKFIKFCTCLAEAYEIVLNYKLKSKNEDDRQREAICINLVFKGLNYLIAGYQNLRLGYLDIANGIGRSAIESFTSALLFSKKELVYYRRYLEDKYSTTKSLDKLIKYHKMFNISKSPLIQLKKFKHFLNKNVHPTRLVHC